MTKQARTILGSMTLFAVALAVASATIGHARQGALNAAHDSVTAALKDDSRQKSLVDFLTTRASLAEARADSEARRADSLAARGRRSEIRYVTLKATAPAPCAPVIAAADSALADAQAEAETARSGLRTAQDAAKDYQAARDTALSALARLTAAATALNTASRPSWRERILPHIGVGGAAGINPIGRPDAVVGLTVSWSF